MPELQTINDVLDELDNIVVTTIEEDSPLGIFAYVYRRTTAKIKEGIETGRFENPERMEQFDVEFARFYIDAFWRHRRGKPVSYSWEVAFDAAKRSTDDLIILQHLLLGMNAHINLDLGIAAAEVAPGNTIFDLKHDFMLVNTLLAELVDEVQQRISRVSPLLFLLDIIGERTDESVVNFSIDKARSCAWTVAQDLAQADEEEAQMMITEVDEEISSLGNLVAHPPGFLLKYAIWAICFFEEKNMRKVIQELKIDL
ncbi:MAG: DUF5995 family protein [Balneolaceae bacterium]|nr:DUF5995 family protein [Balneolaceae bacterium]